MSFISGKTIKGKKRYYLEKSVRLLDGNVKKFSVYLKDYKPGKGLKGAAYEKVLNEKISKGMLDFASEYYRKINVFDEKVLRRLEEIKLGYKEIKKNLNRKQMQDVIDRFTVNFTYESNAIEGNSLTLKDVTFILHEKKAIKGKDLREIYETLNTREAMELVFGNKLRIKERDIIKLHKILVKNTGVSIGYKKLPNFLLGRSVKTAPPEKVEGEMSRLIEWFYKNENMHPLQRASYSHFYKTTQ